MKNKVDIFRWFQSFDQQYKIEPEYYKLLAKKYSTKEVLKIRKFWNRFDSLHKKSKTSQITRQAGKSSSHWKSFSCLKDYNLEKKESMERTVTFEWKFGKEETQ